MKLKFTKVQTTPMPQDSRIDGMALNVDGKLKFVAVMRVPEGSHGSAAVVMEQLRQAMNALAGEGNFLAIVTDEDLKLDLYVAEEVVE